MIVVLDQLPRKSQCYSTTHGGNTEVMIKESVAYAVQDGEATVENQRESRPKKEARSARTGNKYG